MGTSDNTINFLTPQDIALLRQNGGGTPSSFNRLQRAGYTVMGTDQAVIAREIARRFQNGQTQLPELLKNVLVSDIDTRRLIQRQMNNPPVYGTSTVTQLHADQQQPLGPTSQPAPQPADLPTPQPQFMPFGYTVAPTESPEQLLDASFRSGQTIEFRFEPTTQETPLTQSSGSWVEALKVHEQLEAREFEQLLLHSFGEIESFLQNDGYLSNEEIVRAIYDEAIEKQILAEHVKQHDPELPNTFQSKLTDYFWALHEHIQQSPLTPMLSSGLMASQFDLLLPEGTEHLRQPLTEGGYLSSSIIGSALFDTGLERATLNQLIVEHNPAADTGLQAKLSDYLWDVHKSVLDQPLVDQLDPALRYRIVASPSVLFTEFSSLSQPGVESADLHRQRLDGRRAQETEDSQQRANKTGLLRTVLGLRTFEGGMLANLLHNYKIMTQLAEILFNTKQSTPDQIEQNELPAMNNTAELAPRWDWKQIEQEAQRIGLTKQTLEQSGSLHDFLQGRRTGLMNVLHDDGTGTVTPMTGKLYITEVPGKGPMIHIQAEQNDIRLPRTFLGHELTTKDTNNLLKNGEMGRLVDLKDKVTGDPFQGYVALDRDVKRLTVLRADRIYVPTKIKGVELTPQQQASLKAGMPVRLDGLENEHGQTYNAFVQVSAAKRSFKFTRIPEQAQKQTVGRQQQAEPTVNQSMANATQTAETKGKGSKNKGAVRKARPGDEKKAISVVASKGTSRTTTSTSKADGGSTKAQSPKAATTSTEATVNGQKTQKTQQPKKAVKGPKR